jgi:hypothetical protein
MKPSNFLEAVQILTKNHSNEIIVNISKGHMSKTGSAEKPTLHIKNCTAAAVIDLKDAGFTLSMDNGLMSVEDYSKS